MDDKSRRAMLYEELVTVGMVEDHGVPETGRNSNGWYAMFPDGFLVMQVNSTATAYPCAIAPPEPLDWFIKAAITPESNHIDIDGYRFPATQLIEKRWV